MKKLIVRALLATVLSAGGLLWSQDADIRIATIYSSWNSGSYAFRHEWDGVLKPRGWQVDRFENTEIGELAANLARYDLIIGCSVFNLENTQDFAAVREPFLDYLENGGIFLATDVSYGSSLTEGICTWSADFALGWEKASSHTNPSPETRRISYGAAPVLAQVPTDLLPLAQEAGHWAHMLPHSDRWRQALLDSDGKPVLVWQPVGRGLLVATSYYSFKRANRDDLGLGLVDNALLLAQCLRHGLEVTELDCGGLNPGENHCRMTVRNPLDRSRSLQINTRIIQEGTPREQNALQTSLGPRQQVTLQWRYVIQDRGKHALELTCTDPLENEALFSLTRSRDIPDVLELFSWKRHVTTLDDAVVVQVDLFPELPFNAQDHRLQVQARTGDALGPAVDLAPRSQEVRIPLDGLAAGRGAVQARLVRGKEIVASADLPLVVAPEPYVRLMPDRSCRVGGKPFFPLGMYIVSWQLKDTESILAKMRTIAAGGFNLVHVGVRSAEEFRAVLDEASRLSLMVIPEGVVPRQAPGKFRDHPALLAWNPGDEPDGRGHSPEKMAAIAADIRDQDMSRPIYMTLCVPQTYHRYHRVADVLAPDPYPIPGRPVGMVADYIRRLQTVVEYQKPIWAIPQSFGGYSSWKRPPTPAEERNMTYQCLVHGVRGLIYYTFWDGRFDMTQHPDLWAMMRRLAQEVNALAPLYLADAAEVRRQDGPDNAVHLLMKSLDDTHYLIAVNTTDQDLGEVDLSLPIQYHRPLTTVFDDHAIDPTGGTGRIDFPPLAVRVLRTK